MTLEQFLEKLEQTPRDWGLTMVFIRRGKGEDYQCPLAAVAGIFDVSAPHDYAKKLGLSIKLANRIIEADGCLTLEPELRAKLLKACGLA